MFLQQYNIDQLQMFIAITLITFSSAKLYIYIQFHKI